MLSSTTGHNAGWPALAGSQSSLATSWRSSSPNLGATNGASSTGQSATNSAAHINQPPPFDSMMAMLLQTQGIARGETGSPLSIGISDDAQFASGSTAGGSAPLLGNLQSLLSILSNRGASSTAENSPGAASTATASTAVDDLNAMLSKNVQGVANGIVPNAADTTYRTTGTTAGSGNTAASSASTAQNSLPPWAAGWFNIGDSTEAATTGWADAFGQQSGTPSGQFAHAASAYAATGNSSHTRPVTDMTV